MAGTPTALIRKYDSLSGGRQHGALTPGDSALKSARARWSSAFTSNDRATPACQYVSLRVNGAGVGDTAHSASTRARSLAATLYELRHRRNS